MTTEWYPTFNGRCSNCGMKVASPGHTTARCVRDEALRRLHARNLESKVLRCAEQLKRSRDRCFALMDGDVVGDLPAAETVFRECEDALYVAIAAMVGDRFEPARPALMKLEDEAHFTPWLARDLETESGGL
jgi:hypothetical protein